MNALDRIIRQTRKFSNKKNVKLDKNSVIEHAIAYIKELQQINSLYEKRLEESNLQIQSLQQALLSYRIFYLYFSSVEARPLVPPQTVFPVPHVV